MRNFAVYWADYASETGKSGAPVDGWFTSRKSFVQQLNPGDRIWLFTSGANLGKATHAHSGYVVQRFTVKAWTENIEEGDARYKIQGTDSELLAPPLLADRILRKTTSDKSIPIGMARQTPFRLSPQQVDRLLSREQEAGRRLAPATFMLTWNPEIWDGVVTPEMDWSCGNSSLIRPGDRVFIMRQVEEPRGICGAGWAVSRSLKGLPGKHVSKRYVKVRFAEFRDPKTRSIIPWSSLDLLNAHAGRSMNWGSRSSGTQIPPDIASRLENLWSGLDHSESKYAPLAELLNAQTGSTVVLTFSEIEAHLQLALPGSARKHKRWWQDSRTNDSHVWSHLWQRAGWVLGDVSLESEVVTFRRMQHFDIDSAEAREGYARDVQILRRGRNATLARRRKELDRFTCQACAFCLHVGHGFVIDVHHLNPLSESGETTTTIDQLVSLCPTCHRIAHTRSLPYSVPEIQRLRGNVNTGTGLNCSD